MALIVRNRWLKQTSIGGAMVFGHCSRPEDVWLRVLALWHFLSCSEQVAQDGAGHDRRIDSDMARDR